MDMERKNAKESRSAKPQENDLTVLHEEQRIKKSNEVEHCLLPATNTSQSIDKSVPEVKTLDASNNLTTVKDKTTRKSKRTVATVIPVLILAIVVTGLVLIPVLLFILRTNVYGLEAECTAEVYMGEVCQSILVDRQRCIPSRENTSEVYVFLTPSLQAIVEQQLLDLLQIITPSPECEGQLLAFLCVEAFSGFCDSTGIVHRTTRQECEVVTSEVCAAEFEVIFPLLEVSGFDLSCDTFPETTNICNYTYIEKERTSSGQFRASGETLYTGLVGNRSCSDNFFLDETTNLCMPECGEWWPLSANRRNLLITIVLTSICCGNVVSIVVIFLSCLHYKTMFTFPGIFIFYQMLSVFVASILHLLTCVDFKNLMCESRNLIESLMQGNETPLCIISAVSVTYVSHQIALWWIFHLSMVFCAVFWPFKYNYWRQSGYFKYIHTVMVAAGIILPIIPVIICLKVDGYVLYLIQPNCVPRNIQSAFYSYIFPMIIVVAIGLYLLILIFWRFFSEEWKCSRYTNRQVEIKILLILCSYFVIWSSLIISIMVPIIEADEHQNTLEEYFTCEASGTQECEQQSTEGLDKVTRFITLLFVNFYPASFLIYFVKVKNSLLTC